MVAPRNMRFITPSDAHRLRIGCQGRDDRVSLTWESGLFSGNLPLVCRHSVTERAAFILLTSQVAMVVPQTLIKSQRVPEGAWYTLSRACPMAI